jgi:hypothetical protein
MLSKYGFFNYTLLGRGLAIDFFLRSKKSLKHCPPAPFFALWHRMRAKKGIALLD